jgi:DNA repair exonuclease SbcCD ATPase subunit
MRSFVCLIMLSIGMSTGCSSFRTTSLMRLTGHSVSVQQTNEKLKGLPVKLKIPSHLQVSIYEQQVILAADAESLTQAKKSITEAIAEVNKVENAIRSLDSTVEGAEKRLSAARQTLSILESMLRQNPQDQRAAIQKKITDETRKLVDAEAALETAFANRSINLPELAVELALKQGNLDRARAELQMLSGYNIVSFNPPQIIIETELQYTDKIFLVDFRRPAAGILNLKNAALDDEQYFSQIQAEVTERTIEDVSGALNRLSSPLASLRTRDNRAIPTSARTPPAEAHQEVHFQKSIIGFHRFDISSPGWEEQVMIFINHALQSDFPAESWHNSVVLK